MKSIIRTVSATISSILLATGFTRLAEKLDPMSSALDQRTDGLMHEADACGVPTFLATFSAR